MLDEDRSAFRTANAEIVPRILSAEHPGLRAVINMGARSLASFVTEGRYKNAYERPRVEGVEVGPSSRRVMVDTLLFGTEASKRYFAAVSLGGIGCRFYGEYCVVLKQERGRESAVFDRNSYDLTAPPLEDIEDKKSIVDALRGEWERDVIDMVTAKVLPELPATNRLATPGQVSDLVLRDEDFAEVHLSGAITPDAIEEVRKSPEESSLTGDCLDRYRSGYLPDPAELVWAQSRQETERLLREQAIQTRVVAIAGRGFRWR
jgi:hypothetical protein